MTEFDDLSPALRQRIERLEVAARDRRQESRFLLPVVAAGLGISLAFGAVWLWRHVLG